MLHNQYQGWHESWQQIQHLSHLEIHARLKQQQATMLQLASHDFHMQYWNMQCTRRLVCAVHFPLSPVRVLTLKVWSAQTRSTMPRLDFF